MRGATVIFSYRGATTLVRRSKEPSVTNSEELCAMIAMALMLFNRAGIVNYDELRMCTAFLGTLPSDERLSGFLMSHLEGFIWTEIPLVKWD